MFCGAWQLSTHEVARLDRKEAAPGSDGTFHYYRIGMPFVTVAGTRLCHVYIANPDWIQRAAAPEAGYLEHIRKGYSEFGLDICYLEEAEARASHPAGLA